MYMYMSSREESSMRPGSSCSGGLKRLFIVYCYVYCFVYC